MFLGTANLFPQVHFVNKDFVDGFELKKSLFISFYFPPALFFSPVTTLMCRFCGGKLQDFSNLITKKGAVTPEHAGALSYMNFFGVQIAKSSPSPDLLWPTRACKVYVLY